jgi:hypothetical protein
MKMPALEVDRKYKTHDLTLATVISMGGHPFTLEMHRNGRALFVFCPKDGNEVTDMATSVARFRTGDTRVEPMRFMREVRQVREKLYNFLDQNGA